MTTDIIQSSASTEARPQLQRRIRTHEQPGITPSSPYPSRDSLLALAMSPEGERRVAAIEPAIDRQLDVFFGIGYDPTRPGPEIDSFDAEFLTLLPGLQLGVLLASSRFRGGPFTTNVHPHTQLKRFIIETAGTGPKSPARELLSEARGRAPRTWAMLLAAVRELERSSMGAWPSPEAARECLARLEALTPVLVSIAAQRRAERKWGKDPAHLHALHWSGLFRHTLTYLAEPLDGPLQLWVGYQFALLDYFARSIARRRRTGVDTPSARAIVVEEVYSFVSNHALGEAAVHRGEELDPTCGSRARGRLRYRKNNQRARLKALIQALQ